LYFPELQPGRRTFLQRLCDWKILKHNDSVEQGAAAMTCPTLKFVQRHMLVFPQGQILRLQPLHPGADTFRRIDPSNHRQCIDKQTQLLLDTCHLSRTTSHCCTESNTILPCVAL